MFHYIFKEGSYQWVDTDTGNISYICDEVCILFTIDGEEYIMHKHGKYEHVLPYFYKYRKIKNICNLFGVPYIITGKWDVEELNQVIQCSNYIKTFIEKQSIPLMRYNYEDNS